MADMQEEEEGGGVDESWLATYGDLVTLLMCFFVLLYSMSSVDAQKFEATFSAVRESFGGDAMDHIKVPVTEQEVNGDNLALSANLIEEMLEKQRQSFNQIRSFISQQSMDDQIDAVLDNGKIILRLPNDILFAKNSELLSVDAERALQTLMEIFHEEREQTINIKGYSDNSPVPQGSRFYDNWELSALRAVNILRYYLRSGIESHRITATGMGELEPLFPNNSEANKAQNRRVEFVLERELEKE